MGFHRWQPHLLVWGAGAGEIAKLLGADACALLPAAIIVRRLNNTGPTDSSREGRSR